MLKYFIKKLITLIIVLLIISIVVFVAFLLIPGDIAVVKAGFNASTERIEQIRQELGLNLPVYQRYFNWIGGIIRGDFGDSFQYAGTTVGSLLKTKVPYTVVLTILTFVLILIGSVPLGIFAAKKRNSKVDGFITVTTQSVMAIPPFFLGMLITYLFGIVLKIFTPGRIPDPSEDFFASLFFMIFPALAIALPKISMTAKFLKSSILGEVNKDYVRTAYSKGNTENSVLYKHILKNSMIPTITFLGIVIADIVANSIIIERVFNIPGMGTMLVNGITNRDYPVVMATVLIIAAFIIIVNFIIDGLYKILDPRVKV